MVKVTRNFRKRVCEYCKDKKEPNFKEPSSMNRFITERGKIVSRAKTGTCAAHQRKLTTSIKRARILALLPFATRV